MAPLGLARRYDADLLESLTAPQLQLLLTYCVTFLGEARYVNNPYLRARLCEVNQHRPRPHRPRPHCQSAHRRASARARTALCRAELCAAFFCAPAALRCAQVVVLFVPRKGKGGAPAYGSSRMADVLAGHYLARKHLAPYLLGLFVDVECAHRPGPAPPHPAWRAAAARPAAPGTRRVAGEPSDLRSARQSARPRARAPGRAACRRFLGGHSGFYDKFSYRHHMAVILEHVWTVPEFRESVRAQ